MNDLKLVRPDFRFRDSFLAAFRELSSAQDQRGWIYLGDDAPFDAPEKDFQAYVNILLSTETKALPNFVTNTTYWGVIGNEVVGRISVRHELTPFLEKIGGHVGYIVRPSYRRQGVATEMLRQALLLPPAKKLGRVLLTCDETNSASKKTILKNGGIYENTVENPGRVSKKRFWIKIK